ncbi:cytochrome P450 monooxygenase [Aspergillus nomiae NRRL 13137]|uniref:Cytochrome P450 monooxygenase ABA1 n=1 Tax=Aspergillus nomiae NRRL (strain ATCC 15546 / NRRL 13137 / CBS 260.88 / M93) TaxID=1509407 RepID=A0A0L1IMX6_ASPN3|nr:cytochrome P450 monooxygenase [Aspergillus nomiae NRRL 13137]KNG80951.1 cytochrome P450 monooxygenase [Aspergillus nomiae NRRL 13137]
MGAVELLLETRWLIVGGLLVLYFVRKVQTYYRLRKFKGPLSCGFSSFRHTQAVLSLQCERWYKEMTDKYGPIVRIGPNALITSSPELWAHINAVRSPYKRSDWYYHAARFKPGEDHVFSETNSDRHDRRRRQMLMGYSGKENLSLEADIDLRVRDFLDLIRNGYLSTEARAKPMDLAKKVQYLTLDVISTVGLGNSFGMLKADQDAHGYIKSGEEGLWMSNFLMGTGLHWIMQIEWVGKLLGPSTNDSTGFGKMMATTGQMVAKRLQSSTDARSDMLASFIRHGLIGNELWMEAFEQVLAGSDTTASGIRGILLCLLSNPRVYKKLQAEIDDAVRDDKAPSSDIMPDAQLRRLTYLQAVIREGLRVFVPVVNIFPRDVPSEGDEVILDGESVKIPGGTWIGYSALGMHLNKATYGDDAEVFRPERWLIEDKDHLANMTRVNDLIFGYGRWKCLGHTVALIEISKTIFEALRNFDWALVNPEQPWRRRNVNGLFAVTDMWVTVTAREKWGSCL